jgi:hypothetical protein
MRQRIAPVFAQGFYIMATFSRIKSTNFFAFDFLARRPSELVGMKNTRNPDMRKRSGMETSG